MIEKDYCIHPIEVIREAAWYMRKELPDEMYEYIENIIDVDEECAEYLEKVFKGKLGKRLLLKLQENFDKDLKELQEKGGEYFVFPLNPEERRKLHGKDKRTSNS